MDTAQLRAKRRQLSTKAYLKILRKDSKIPGIIYGKGLDEGIPFFMDYSSFLRFVHKYHWENTIIELTVEDDSGKEEIYTTIVQDIEHHPLTDKIIHLDLHKISLTEAIHVKVPVVSVGEAEGVKKGGVLEHMVWELNVACLPTQIPDSIKVDVSALDIGDSVHIKDITLPEGIKVLDSPETVLFVVEYGGTKIESTSSEEGEEQEPQVISKGKEEAEG